VLIAAVGILALALILLGAGSWYASTVIGCRIVTPQRVPAVMHAQVLSATADAVTLRITSKSEYCGAPNNDWEKDGIWGLYWLGGYAEIDEILAIDREARTVTRRMHSRRGTPPVGTHVRFDSLVYPEDPAAAHGIAFDRVTFPGELGAYPAWFVPGDDDTWVIVVHGRGAGRRDGLRILPTLHRLGLPTMVISYRNDIDAPGGDAASYAFGATEWRDVESAVQYAVSHGASDVVLYAYSMGGGVAVAFLLESGERKHVSAAVLDAPALDFGEMAASGLRAAGVPGLLTPLPIWLTEWRFDTDFSNVRYGDRVDGLQAPILLFHGTEDDMVPVSISNEFAERRRDIVRYEPFPGAHHTRAWNLDPQRYEETVVEFLRAHALGR
jgi:alpha-beta hydrolase superfamily lysophospholipase